MTDYRKRLEALDDHERLTCPARYAECTCGYTAKLESFAAEAAAEADRLLSEVGRMRELVADLERRAEACDKMFRKATDGLSQYRLGGKADAYRHAALTARQALGDPE